MKPTSNDKKSLPVTCPECSWSRDLRPGENAEQASRYHRIQCHNDLVAVLAGKY